MRAISAMLPLAAALFLTGCYSTEVFTYPNGRVPMLQADQPAFAGRKIAVRSFVESQNNWNSHGGIALILLPLFPYGEINLGNPAMANNFVTIERFYFLPSRDLAMAAVRSLEHSGLFGEVVMASGTAADDADYFLEGEIQALDYRGRIFTYGIPIVGPVLSILGAPYGSSRDHMQLQLKLRDRAGNVLWSKNSDRTESTIQGLYYHWGRDVAFYPEFMTEAMNQMIQDLSTAPQPQAE